MSSSLVELCLDLTTAQTRNVEGRTLEPLFLCDWTRPLGAHSRFGLGQRLGGLLGSLDKTSVSLGLLLLELGLALIESTLFALHLGNVHIDLGNRLFDAIENHASRLGRLDVDEFLLLFDKFSELRIQLGKLLLDRRRLLFLERLERATRNDRLDRLDFVVDCIDLLDDRRSARLCSSQ